MSDDLVANFLIGTANFEKVYELVNPKKLSKLDILGISHVISEFNITNIDTALSYSNQDPSEGKSIFKFYSGRSVTTKVALKDLPSFQSKKELVKLFIDNLDRKSLLFY